jgi:hypothetical protein
MKAKKADQLPTLVMPASAQATSDQWQRFLEACPLNQKIAA